MSNLKVKGTMINVAILVVGENENNEKLEKNLEESIINKISFFIGIPFIIDFRNVNDIELNNITNIILDKLKENNISAIGVRCTDNQWKMLEKRNSLYRDTSETKKEYIKEEKEKVLNEKVDSNVKEIASCQQDSNLVINRNIRSGQQIYAEGRSVIVFGNVSSGAEIISDGNIIVMGSLKGKAIAGACGDKNTIIQARKMEPELLSIAGVFLASEDLDNFDGVYGNFATCKMDVKNEEITFIS